MAIPADADVFDLWHVITAFCVTKYSIRPSYLKNYVEEPLSRFLNKTDSLVEICFSFLIRPTS